MSERSKRSSRKSRGKSKQEPDRQGLEDSPMLSPSTAGHVRQVEYEKYSPTLDTGFNHTRFQQSYGDTLNTVDRKVDLIVVFPIEIDDKNGIIQHPHYARDESRKSRRRRTDILKRLFAAGLEITQATNMDKTAWIVRLSAPTKLLLTTAEQMHMKARLLRTEMEIEQNSIAGFAPFSEKFIDHFEIGFTRQFGSTERLRLVLHLMKVALGDPTDPLYQQVVAKHMAQGDFKAIPLHDPVDRADLLKLWVNGGGGRWWFLHPQPLTKIRDYFGEEIAMYFAFVEHFWSALSLPAVLGILTFGIGKAIGDDMSAAVLVYTIFMNAWSIFFLEIWTRKEKTYQVEWDCADFESTAENRLDFEGRLRRSRITPFRYDMQLDKMVENMVPQFLFEERAKRYMVTIPILLLVIGVVLVCALNVVLFNYWIINSGYLGAVDSAIGGVANTVTIMILTGIYENVAYRLNDYENHQTENQYVDALTFKKFVFQFCNNYTALLSTVFLMGHITIFGVSPVCESDPHTPESCTDLANSLILSTMISAIVVGNVTEAAVPYFQHRLAERQMEEDSVASLSAVVEEGQSVKLHPSEHEMEMLMPEYEGTFNDYLEIAMSFGFVTLFASIFPLGPALAWINLTIEIRSDAFKMVKVHQRPHYLGAADIGSWSGIFSILALAATMANVFILATTDLYSKVGLTDDSTEQKLLCAIILEHILFFVKFVVADLIPDEPEDLQDIQIRLEKKVAKMQKDDDNARARALIKRRTLNVVESVTEAIVAQLEDVDVKKWRNKIMENRSLQRQNTLDPAEEGMDRQLRQAIDEEMGLSNIGTSGSGLNLDSLDAVASKGAGAIFERGRVADRTDLLHCQTVSQGKLDFIEDDPDVIEDELEDLDSRKRRSKQR